MCVEKEIELVSVRMIEWYHMGYYYRRTELLYHCTLVSYETLYTRLSVHLYSCL